MDMLSNLSLLDALAIAALGGMILTIMVLRVSTWFIDRDIARMSEAFDAERKARSIAYPTLMPAVTCALPEGPVVSLSTMTLSAITCAAIDPRSL